MTRNFFNYFPVAKRDLTWGIVASSFGNICVPPGAPYPLGHHPEDHNFAWEKGRVLNDYQLIYLRKGEGVFETHSTQVRKVSQGTVFLLFPGIWHRYRPEGSTGWTEMWIEANGPHLAQLRASRLIDSLNPIYRIESTREINELFGKAQDLAQAKPPGFGIRIGLILIEILTLLRPGTTKVPASSGHIVELISEAQALLGESPDKKVPPNEVAKKIGLSYSYFRREFKQQTGFSPKQFQIELRVRKAKELLRNTRLSIKEISEQLGYSSPYHLTLEFSKSTGSPPSNWRNNLQKPDASTG